jgi:uncharacterized protein (UPF0303 family)
MPLQWERTTNFRHYSEKTAWKLQTPVRLRQVEFAKWQKQIHGSNIGVYQQSLFQSVFSGNQLRQMYKRNRRFEHHLAPHHQRYDLDDP